MSIEKINRRIQERIHELDFQKKTEKMLSNSPLHKDRKDVISARIKCYSMEIDFLKELQQEFIPKEKP